MKPKTIFVLLAVLVVIAIVGNFMLKPKESTVYDGLTDAQKEQKQQQIEQFQQMQQEMFQGVMNKPVEETQ